MQQLALLVAASAAAAFAPTPNQRIDTRLHFNFGNFGGKKVDEEEAVKLAETVDVVGALPTEMEGLTPELDGLRKANALFNQGLISVDEIDEYADTLAAAKRKEVAEKERDAREAAEREARARERTRAAARAATGAVGGLVGFVGRGAGITSYAARLGSASTGTRENACPRLADGASGVAVWSPTARFRQHGRTRRARLTD